MAVLGKDNEVSLWQKVSVTWGLRTRQKTHLLHRHKLYTVLALKSSLKEMRTHPNQTASGSLHDGSHTLECPSSFGGSAMDFSSAF